MEYASASAFIFWESASACAAMTFCFASSSRSAVLFCILRASCAAITFAWIDCSKASSNARFSIANAVTMIPCGSRVFLRDS